MNTNTIFLNLLLMAFVLLTSCSKSNDRFNGSDNIITLTRDLPGFTEIVAESSLSVNITHNNTQIVEVRVNDNLQDQLLTSVSDGTLFISIADGNYRNDNFEVNIQLPNLAKLALDDDTRGKVKFTADQLEFKVNDSAELTLEGSSEILNTMIDDDGKISAFSFKAAVVNATVNDDSELEITCTKELNGTVNDDSEISYRGMPAINVQTSDNGKVLNAN